MLIQYCSDYCVFLKQQIITNFCLLRGIWLLSKLPRPIVTVFGGTNLTQDNFYARQAHTLAHRLADNRIAVLTGGGPGIMEAANCGAKMGEGKGIYSMGIGVTGIDDRNVCTQLFIQMRDFSARKYLLIQYSTAFAVFPGGFGTLDELASILTLIKTKKMKGVPVILFGKSYWQPFMDWLTKSALANNLITNADLQLFIVSDDLEEIFHLLCEKKQR